MYLFYCDETNLDPTHADFFVYGGLAIPSEKAHDLHEEIEQIRKDAGIRTEHQLKFNPCPEGIEYKNFVNAKEKIIKAAASHDCCLIVSIILHKIANDPDTARRNEINRVVYHFNCFLNRPATHGLVLIDRFSDKQIDSHLREKFASGIKGLPYTPVKRLDNIIGFHYSAIGQSHFPSIVDILLGSLRFAINVHTKGKTEKVKTAKYLLKLMEPLFYRDSINKKVHSISLNFSPNIIKVKKYRMQYQSVKDFLCEAGINAGQPITETRMY